MRQSFKKFQLYVLLMFFWLLLNGSFTPKMMIYGTIFSIIIIMFTSNILFKLDDDMLRLPPTWRFVWFGVIVAYAILKASISHVLRIIKNECRYKVLYIQLDTNNTFIITLIANAITLTPGTITLEVEMSKLKVLGFAKNERDLDAIKEEVMQYQKPFLYRRV